MTVPVWPSDLPQAVLLQSYTQTLADGRLMTKTDTGPGKRRLRWAGMQEVACGIAPLEMHALSVFKNFWSVMTAGGTLPFFIPDQSDDGRTLADAGGDVLTTADGSSLVVTAWWLAQFGKSPPQLMPITGTCFRATFNLEVLP